MALGVWLIQLWRSNARAHQRPIVADPTWLPDRGGINEMGNARSLWAATHRSIPVAFHGSGGGSTICVQCSEPTVCGAYRAILESNSYLCELQKRRALGAKAC